MGRGCPRAREQPAWARAWLKGRESVGTTLGTGFYPPWNRCHMPFEAALTPGDPANEGRPRGPVLTAPLSSCRRLPAAAFTGSVHRGASEPPPFLLPLSSQHQCLFPRAPPCHCAPGRGASLSSPLPSAVSQTSLLWDPLVRLPAVQGIRRLPSDTVFQVIPFLSCRLLHRPPSAFRLWLCHLWAACQQPAHSCSCSEDARLPLSRRCALCRLHRPAVRGASHGPKCSCSGDVPRWQLWRRPQMAACCASSCPGGS